MQKSTRVEHRQNGKNDWETPSGVFDPLDEEFGFTLDVCASHENAKCWHYYTGEGGFYKHDSGIPRQISHNNGLTADWMDDNVCWMNPPYDKWQLWVKKAYEESLKGATVVCLLPARTDTKAFHQWILPFAEIRFIKGRVTFVGAENPAPFPSMIVIFRPPKDEVRPLIFDPEHYPEDASWKYDPQTGSWWNTLTKTHISGIKDLR